MIKNKELSKAAEKITDAIWLHLKKLPQKEQDARRQRLHTRVLNLKKKERAKSGSSSSGTRSKLEGPSGTRRTPLVARTRS